MHFGPRVPLGILGLFALATVGCSGGSPTQASGDLPAAVAGRAVSGGSAATPARAAHRLGGVRRAIAGCSGTGANSFVGGTFNNVAAGGASGVLSGAFNDACDSYSGIVAGDSNTINSGSADYDFIGAGDSNAISGSGLNTFIGAGDSNAISAGNSVFIGAGVANVISGGDRAFIGAGEGNQISGSGALQAVIGGGWYNTNTANNGVVTGGQYNNTSGAWGSIGGGYGNKSSGQYASITGGNANTASGTESTVAGGGANVASGYASFAAGYHADANQSGSFVWSDNSSSHPTTPTAAGQFVARASGGVEFFSNAAMTTGLKLPAGGGSWASVSDRAVKTNVQPIDDAQILDRVASMPISEWSYISEQGVRHVGPMAQDFYAAFGIGEDNKHITSIDEDGVALAAIKALHSENDALRMQLARLRTQQAADHRQLRDLVSRMSTTH